MHSIGAVIPPRRSRGQRRRGRPLSYDRVRYRNRNVVERCLGWLKECRALATRFEKLAVHYHGLVHLAIIERYLRILTRTSANPVTT
jgi:transposase